MDYEKFLKSHRKKRLFDPTSLPVTLDCGRPEIERIIPQRSPILYVDALDGLDDEKGAISGHRLIPTDDPVFAGHFPEYPVYPGSYALEMIGQLGLCLYYFLENDRNAVALDAEPVRARATRVLGAYFLEAITPGQKVDLLSVRTEYDGFLARAVGQAVVDGVVCCVAAAEVCIL